MTTLTSNRASTTRSRESSGGFFSNIGLYLYAFYVVYTPTFSTSFLASKFVILSVLAVLIVIHGALSQQRPLKLLTYSPLRNLLIVLFILSMYIAVVRVVSQPEVLDIVDLRIVQNNILLLMAVHAAFILHICQRRGFDAESILRVFYRLAAFQGVWALLSFVVPQLKEISNAMYQMAAGERVFTVAARIYGFMGEFTFVTPIYHGMLAATAVYFALVYKFRGLRYIPLILIAILLNGRTGAVVFVAMSAIIILARLLAGKSVVFSVIIFSALGSAMWGVWALLSEFSPNTASFLQRFIDETDALVSDGSREGTYAILYDELMTLPEGMRLLWGTGDHVYKNVGEFRADVGFTNDIFMGGLIFVVLGYGAFAYFIFKNSKPDQVLFVAVTVGLIIANLKGQIFRGSAVLFLVVLIVLLHKGMKSEAIPSPARLVRLSANQVPMVTAIRR